MCKLKARKQQKKRGKIPSFANSMGQSCWQSWASPRSACRLCQQLRPMLLAKQTVGKAGLLCQPVFANSRRFPVGEGNGSRADGVPPSPTAHVAVGEAFPTGPAFLLAKSSFPSLKTPTVLSQQELGNPVGKAFANRVGVFANSLALLAKRAFPVVININMAASIRCALVATFHTVELPRMCPGCTSHFLEVSTRWGTEVQNIST
jgi:hypothetical protein